MWKPRSIWETLPQKRSGWSASALTRRHSGWSFADTSFADTSAREGGDGGQQGEDDRDSEHDRQTQMERAQVEQT